MLGPGTPRAFPGLIAFLTGARDGKRFSSGHDLAGEGGGAGLRGSAVAVAPACGLHDCAAVLGAQGFVVRSSA
jgi:hypothetical protein